MHRLIAVYGKVTSIVQAITRNRDSGREALGRRLGLISCFGRAEEACATDETKLWLTPSAKRRRKPFSAPPPPPPPATLPPLCIRIWVRAMIGS